MWSISGRKLCPGSHQQSLTVRTAKLQKKIISCCGTSRASGTVESKREAHWARLGLLDHEQGSGKHWILRGSVRRWSATSNQKQPSAAREPESRGTRQLRRSVQMNPSKLNSLRYLQVIVFHSNICFLMTALVCGTAAQARLSCTPLWSYYMRRACSRGTELAQRWLLVWFPNCVHSERFSRVSCDVQALGLAPGNACSQLTPPSHH